jgi:hypothetical protein
MNARLLKEIVPKIQYKENWGFSVFSSGGDYNRYVFRVVVQAPDSRDMRKPDGYFRAPYSEFDFGGFNTNPDVGYVNRDPFWFHTFGVDPYPMDERGAWRWILEKILLVERHESMEEFKVDGVAVFYPDHEKDPYSIPGDV